MISPMRLGSDRVGVAAYGTCLVLLLIAMAAASGVAGAAPVLAPAVAPAAECGWVQVASLGAGSTRDAAGVFLPDEGVHYIYGGLSPGTTAARASRDVFTLRQHDTDPERLWAQRASQPSAQERWGHAAALAERRGQPAAYWLGGNRSDIRSAVITETLRALNTVVEFLPGQSGVNWSEAATVGSAPFLQDHAAVYFAPQRTIIVHGGREEVVIDHRGMEVPARPRAVSEVTYALVYDSDSDQWAWQDFLSLTSGPRLYGHTLTMDHQRQRVLLFGGTLDGLDGANEVWELTLSGGLENATWSRLATDGQPPLGRFNHVAALDPVQQRLIVYGGRGRARHLNDTWELDLTEEPPRWRELRPRPSAGARVGAVLYFDTGRERMILAGGTGLDDRPQMAVMELRGCIRALPTPTPTTTPSRTPVSPTAPASPSVTPSATSTAPVPSSTPTSVATVTVTPTERVEPTPSFTPPTPTPTASPTMPNETPIATATASQQPVRRIYLPYSSRFAVLVPPTETPLPPPPTITPTPEGCLEIEREDNDSPLQSLEHPPLCENRIIEGTMSDAERDRDRDDYYWIEPLQSGRVQLDLWNIPFGEADFDLYVYDWQYQELAWSNTRSDRETIRLSVREGERYFVRVWRAEGTSSRPYKLQWSTIE